MHTSMGLGVAAVSVLTAMGAFEGDPRAIANNSAGIEQDAPPESEFDIVVEDSKCAWFNMLWVEFLGTSGEWLEEAIDDDTVLMRPLDDDCNFGIRLLWKEQIVYFPMPQGTELAFDGDWIKVDQTGKGIDLRGRSTDQGAGAGDASGTLDSGCALQLDSSLVAEVEWDGTCWQSDSNPGAGCEMRQTCDDDGSADGCGVRVIHSSGTGIQGSSFSSACGGTLTVTKCTVGGGRSLLCVAQ